MMKRICVLGCAVLGICSLTWVVSGQNKEKAEPKLFSRMHEYYEKRAGARVEPGDQKAATAYYDAVATAVDFPGKQFPGDLNALLILFGSPLTAEQIEGKLPAEVEASGITTARFFSPKTTDVSLREKPQKISWRQVVHITAQEGSEARRLKLKELWWLSNIYSPDTKAPFSQESQNNQVILVPDEPIEVDYKDAISMHRLFFAVYAARSRKYVRAHSTSTSWDAGTANPTAPADPSTAYFTPESCIQCHGNLYPNARLNFLDTDYYLWRTADEVDYPTMKGVAWQTAAKGFDFKPFQKMNERMHAQNQQADPPGKPNFQTNSIANWLKHHPADLKEVAPEVRGWLAQDRELAGLLVKYCYRCHGTIEYSVLDGAHIKGGKKDDMLGRIGGGDMPQDRYSSGTVDPKVQRDLERIKALLEKL